MPTLTTHSTDEMLADGLKNGRQDALSVVYDKYASRLFHLSQKILKNTATAEDALKASFITIWHNRHSYDPSAESFSAWLSQIVLTTAHTLHEKNSGGKENQNNTRYVNTPNLIFIELIKLGLISPKEATEKMKITTDELRKMLRKEINQLRGVEVE